MATKLYTIENLLVGQNYRSRNRNFEGVVTHAEKREGIWYGENLDAYVVEVKSTRGIKNFWATVTVRTGE